MKNFRNSKLVRSIVTAVSVGVLAFGAVACEGENPVETDVGDEATAGAEDQQTGVDADVEEEQGETTSPTETSS